MNRRNKRNNNRRSTKVEKVHVKNANQPKCPGCGAVRRANSPFGRKSRGVTYFTHYPSCTAGEKKGK